jgi:hypothetical protein
MLTPGLDYSDPTKLFLRNTIYGSGYGKVPSVEDELKGFKLAGTMPAPAMLAAFFSDIDFGLNYADREPRRSASPKATSTSVRRVTPPSRPTCSTDWSTSALPAPA